MLNPCVFARENGICGLKFRHMWLYHRRNIGNISKTT